VALVVAFPWFFLVWAGTANQLQVGDLIKLIPATEWRLTQNQKDKLIKALESVAEAERFEVQMATPITSASGQTFMDDLVVVFNAHGWVAKGNLELRLKPNIIGLHIAVSPAIKTDDLIPPKAELLAKILAFADIKPQGSHVDWLEDDKFLLVIGSKPQ
jgi:hypothetical protein